MRGFVPRISLLVDPEWVVSGIEIYLERINEESVDTLSISFDKYPRPRFQVGLICEKKVTRIL